MWIRAREPAHLKESLQIPSRGPDPKGLSSHSGSQAFPVLTEVVTCITSCDCTCLLPSLWVPAGWALCFSPEYIPRTCADLGPEICGRRAAGRMEGGTEGKGVPSDRWLPAREAVSSGACVLQPRHRASGASSSYCHSCRPQKHHKGFEKRLSKRGKKRQGACIGGTGLGVPGELFAPLNCPAPIPQCSAAADSPVLPAQRPYTLALVKVP